MLRRTAPLVLGFVVLVLGAACDASQYLDDDGDAPGKKVSLDNVAAVPELNAALPDSVEERGTLTIGAEIGYAPMSFYDDDGETIIGFEADLARALGRVLGVETDMKPTAWAGIFPALNSGRFDLVINAVTDTEQRQRQLEFVDYFSAGTGVLIDRSQEQDITGLRSLCGRTVVVQKGTQQVPLVERYDAECDEPMEILEYPSQDQPVLQLRNGRADAALMDLPAAAWMAKTVNDGEQLMVVEDAVYERANYGIALPKGDLELAEVLSKALRRLQRDGVYQALLEKWGLTSGKLVGAPINGKAAS